MAILYWVNQGRLGNLLFQYAALLENTSPDDRIYSFDNEVFDLLDVDRRFRRLPTRGWTARRIGFRAEKLVRAAERLKVIGSLVAEPIILNGGFQDESDRMVKSFGFFRQTFAVRGFFQWAHLGGLRVRERLLASARQTLRSAAGNAQTAAIHLRFTDYAEWKVLGVAGALLPPGWYLSRIAELRRRVPGVRFVIVSDDIAAARAMKLGDDTIYLGGHSVVEDFAAIAVCDHAVISPSTFAWWAAMALPSAGKIVMAPTYWAGFKSGVWFPSGIQTVGIEYYPVELSEADAPSSGGATLA